MTAVAAPTHEAALGSIYMPLTPSHRALCLMLRRQGGWWTVPAIVAHWSPTFTQAEVQRLLQDLKARYYVTERDAHAQQPSYGVSSGCIALPQHDWSTYIGVQRRRRP